MMDVLIYLFENYMINDVVLDSKRDELAEELLGAGFSDDEVLNAFVWVEAGLDAHSVGGSGYIAAHSPTSSRVYAKEEIAKLGGNGLELLTRLVRFGVLDQFSREMVIDRLMAIDSKNINVNHIKWVVVMVLSNHPGFDGVTQWGDVMAASNKIAIIH